VRQAVRHLTHGAPVDAKGPAATFARRAVGNILLVLFCLVAGVIARRSGRFPDATPAVLARVVVDVALPAMTLLFVPRITVDGAAGLRVIVAAMATPWIVFGLAFGLLSLVARARGWSRGTLGALVLTAGLGNTSFLGFPLVEAFYGTEGLRTAVVVDQAGSFLVFATVGVAVAAVSAGRARPTPLAFAKRLVTFPPFLAFVLAVLLRGVTFPSALVVVLEKLAALIVPLAVLSVGFQLRFDRTALAQNGRRAAFALGLKLGLAPLLVLALLRVAGVGGLSADVIVAEAAMGPMITAAMLAVEEELDPPLATLMVGLGVPASLLTVGAWSLLLRLL
jgi:predicted permease